MSRGKDLDLLHGSIADKVLMYALPLAATGILQQLFNAADVAVIGRFVGKHAMAAVGSNTPVVGLLVNAFVGISIGANVVLSNSTGRGDAEEVSQAAHTSITFSFLAGLVIMLLGEIAARPLLTAMGVPEEVMPMSLLYLRVYLAGCPVIFLYHFESAIFRSQGDTRTPLICLTISGVLNVILNIFFVVVLHMTVEGVALATVISNLVSSSLLLYFLLRHSGLIHVELRRLGIDRRILGRIIQIGLPAGLQSAVFSLSNIVIQSAINGLGADVMAASSAAFNVEIFVNFVVNAFGQACTTYVGQNYGAGQMDRCRRSTRICLVMNICFTAVMSFLVVTFGKSILGLFNSDPMVAEIGMVRIRAIATGQIICACMEIISGAMRGYGRSMIPAVITLVGVVGTRMIWVYTVFRPKPDFGTLVAVYPISWTITTIILIAAYYLMMRRLMQEKNMQKV